MRDWNSLDPAEQTKILVEYGHVLDAQPPTCSLDAKIERFRHWLKREKRILY